MNIQMLRAGFAGGLVLFIYSALAWTVLPWNEGNIRGFPDEASLRVAAAPIRENGIFMMPMAESLPGALPTPMVFASVLPGGPKPMVPAMGAALAADLFLAVLAAWLLLQTKGLGYWQRVAFVAGLGVLYSAGTNFNYWNWFGFPTAYTVVQILDGTAGWLLAGLAMARLAKSQ